MENELTPVTDQLIRRERRSILFALCVIVGLSIGAIVEVLGRDADMSRYMTLIAFAIVITIVVTGCIESIARKGKLEAQRKAVRKDELRLTAIDGACRYAFVITMTAMSLYAAVSQRWPLDVLPSTLIGAFVVTGVIVFLITFLVLDRH